MKTINQLSFNNPATGEVFGEVDALDPEKAPDVIAELRACTSLWSSKPVKERVRILRKFQHLMLDSADEITAVMNRDTGKSRQDALAEVLMTVLTLDKYLKHAPQWLKKRRVSSGIFVFKQSYVEPKPYGVVLVISPWNYPFYLAMNPVLAALLAGNTVVLKPSDLTSATSVVMEKVLHSLPELAQFVRVVHGEGNVGAALVAAAPDYIYLTGSPQTGRSVMKAAAENMVPVASELGGKDPVIVLEDADLSQAAYWTVNGAFYNTGQTCIAASRVYVVEDVYDQFVDLVVEFTKILKIGYTARKESPYYLGPIKDKRQLGILDRHLKDAEAKGARLLTGNKRDGQFVSPVIVVDATHDMLLLKEEVFGPVLPIIKVKDEGEAIHLANDSDFGLSGSVWSNNLQRAQRVAGRVETGTITINDSLAHFAIPMLPFGGIKQSGYGRTHGKEGLMQFTRTFGMVVSKPPHPLDIAVIMRKPGHYGLGISIMKILFGTTLRQRLLGFLNLIKKNNEEDIEEQSIEFSPDNERLSIDR
ncbi:MAG: aldehyde dehydrogenase family protein [Chloroflexi bacterium]|nr:MAG: aldehyde dehydrogenase family protein [Chloroflexota bacterium]